jgi:hypothetical protein
VAPAKPAAPKKETSAKRKISVEDISEDLIHSEPPRNARNILGASDGSDDDFVGLPASASMDVDGDEDEDVVEIVEKSEEDEEAELSMCLLSMFRYRFKICHRAHVEKVDLTGLCVL